MVRVPLSSMRDAEFPALESGYLDIAKLAPQLDGLATQWIADFVEVDENGRRLPQPRVVATQLSLASDKSFASFEQALARVREPLPSNDENLVAEQLHFDVLLEFRIQSEKSAFAIRPRLEHLATDVLTVLRFITPDGAVRAYEFTADPGLVPLDPSWLQAAGRFVKLGFLHILDGPDHLLFLLCLVIPFRRLRPLILIATAFTVAHSFTLIASAFGLTPSALWFPPLIETLIAASIVYMALENIAGASSTQRRWMFAFGFGLIHGFGFSFALRQTLQFAGSHLLTSLVSFNLGVELGQILALALMVPALELLFRFVVPERTGAIIVSALVAHTAWHWMTARFDVLSRYEFAWTGLTATQTAEILRWLMGLLFAAGVVWMASAWLRRRPSTQLD